MAQSSYPNLAGQNLFDDFSLTNQVGNVSDGYVNNDFNTPVAKHIISNVIWKCSYILIQETGSKKLLLEVFRDLGLYAVMILMDEQLQDIIPQPCPMAHSWTLGSEKYPTKRTCCFVTCPHIGTLVSMFADHLKRLWSIKLCHLLVNTFLVGGLDAKI